MASAWFRGGSVGTAFLVAAIACGPVVSDAEGSADDAADTSNDNEGTSVTDATMTSTTTDGTTGMTTSPTTTATTGVTTTPTTDDTASTVTVMTDPTIDPDPTGDDRPNGSACADNLECASGLCYVLGPLGGLCGECLVDRDCPGGGCTMPNPFSQPPTHAACNDGAYGVGCMSDGACQDGLMCTEVLDVLGEFMIQTCSECRDSGDCPNGWSCEPDLALLALTGVKRCVAPASLANGQTCDFEQHGDIACASGHCVIADAMGFASIGVCSPCESDADCGDAMICTPPQIELNVGPIPGECV